MSKYLFQKYSFVLLLGVLLLSSCFKEESKSVPGVSGVLQNPDGSPASGVVILLLERADSLANVAWLDNANLPFDTLKSTTNSDGSFKFENIKAGSYSVAAVKVDGTDTSYMFIPDINIKSDNINKGTVKLEGTGSFEVQIIKSGRELSGVICILPELHISQISDSAGNCSFHVPPGSYDLEFVSHIYEINPVDVTVAANQSRQIKNYTAEYSVEEFTMQLQTTDNSSSMEPGNLVKVKVETKTQIKAVPGNGVTFVRWQVKEGEAEIDNVIEESTNVLILENAVIEAVFRRNVKLTVVGSGSGSVTPSAPVTLALGNTYEIEAVPEQGWDFNGWTLVSGNANFGSEVNSATNVTVFNDAVVEAMFAVPTVSVAASANGNGKVMPDTAKVPEGKWDSVWAVPDAGNVFSEWKVLEGNVTIENASSPNTRIQADKTGRIEAVFERATGSLTIEHEGNGITIPSGPTSILLGKATTLKAVPDSGWHFKKWMVTGGNVVLSDSTDPNASINPATNASVRAVFHEFSVELKLSRVGEGTTSPSADTSVHPDTNISIKATPAPDWQFVRWVVKEGAAFIQDFNQSETTVRLTRNSEIQAQFIRIPVSLSVQLVGKGSLSPSGDTVLGQNQSLGLKAVADSGWEFSKWQLISGTGNIVDDMKDSTSASFGTDATLRGIFKIIDFDLRVSIEGKGQVNRDSVESLASGESHSIQAFPDSGYVFSDWEVTSGTASISDDASSSTDIQLFSDAALKAKFVPGKGLLTANFKGQGSLSLQDTQTVTLVTPMDITANPSPGWSFVNWVVKSGNASFENPFNASTKVTLKGPSEIEALFSRATTQINVSVTGEGTTTPTGNATVEIGSSFELRAVPSSGWKFSKWEINSGIAVLDDSLKEVTNIVIHSPTSLQAVFESNQAPLTVSQEGSGSTTPDQSIVIEKGVPYNISATPDAGWSFVSWQVVGGGAVFANLNDANTTVTITDSSEIKAVFSQSDVTLTLTAGLGGSTQPVLPQAVSPGSQVDVTAIPNSGSVFSHWEVETGLAQVEDSTSASTKITLSSNTTLKAHFNYELIMVQSGQGSITPSGIIAEVPGSEVSISAQAADGWFFVKWTLDTGTAIVGDTLGSNTTVTLNSPSTVRATFGEFPVKLSISTEGQGSYLPAIDTFVTKNQLVPIEALADEGWKFLKWEEVSGNPVISDKTSSFTYVALDKSSSIKAFFGEVDTVNVTTNINGGTTAPSGIVYPPRGDTLELTASPYPNHIFSHWTGQTGKVNILDSTKAVTQGIVNGNDVVTAVFIKQATLELKVTGGAGVDSIVPGTVNPTDIQLVNSGGTIPVSASPNPFHRFVQWKILAGNPVIQDVKNTSTNVTVTDSSVVAAEFKQISILTTMAEGSGSVSPAADTVDLGDSVTVTATPRNALWLFNGWELEYGQAHIGDINSRTTSVLLLSDSVVVKGKFKWRF